jgi:pimeloyl-ACP methyl ester carboxylesterase
MIKKYFFIALIGLTITSYATWDNSPYFNTTLLSNYKAVRKKVIAEEEFSKVCFTTEDDVEIVGLYKKVPHARGTIVFCGGFYPGQKEGMISYYPYFNDGTYNMLFFDARGHGESKGAFLSALEQYGKNDYKDVIAALDFAKEQSDAPIFLHTICIGSFHTVRAVSVLKNESRLNDYPIIGMVIDSGITSLRSAMKIPAMHIREKVLPGYLATMLYGTANKTTKKNAQVSLPFYVIDYTLIPLINGWINLCEWRATDYAVYENIFEIIEAVPCPIFFVHGVNDEYSDVADIKKVAQSVNDATTWWIEGRSSHTNNQLIHKDEYKKRLDLFLKKCFLHN